MAENSDVLVVDPNIWAAMTVPERKKYLHELTMTKKTFILNGVKHVYDSNLGPVSWSVGGPSTNPKVIESRNQEPNPEQKPMPSPRDLFRA
jgi:hypothetical protein